MRHRFMIGFVALLLTACSQLQMAPLPPASGSGSVQSSIMPVQNLMPDSISGALILGSNNARVTMVLFTNPDCPYCKQFQHDLLPKLHEEFIDVGTLKVEMISLPLKKYSNSERSAKTLICGEMSGSGASIYDQLFNGKTTFPSLKSCMDDKSGAVGKMYAAQQETIRSLDVTLIPTYFLNGKKFTGLPDYADLRGQIETAQNN